MHATARLAIALSALALGACAGDKQAMDASSDAAASAPAPAPIVGRWLPDTTPHFATIDRTTKVAFPEGRAETLISIADAYDDVRHETRTVVYLVRLPNGTPTGALINVAPELDAEAWAQVTDARDSKVYPLRGTLLLHRADASAVEGELTLSQADSRAVIPGVTLAGRWTLLERPPSLVGEGLTTMSGLELRSADPERQDRRKTAGVWPWEEIFSGKPYEEPTN